MITQQQQPSSAEHHNHTSRAPSMTSRTPTMTSRADHLALDDELRLGKEIEAEHQLGLSNWIPLFLVILPNLGAMFFDGEPESWRDSLIFLLIVFFLYKISKAPWQLYASARTTRIVNQARIQSSLVTRQPAEGYSKTIYPIKTDQFLTELKRNEMGFLLLATFSPVLGIGLLLYLQNKLDLGLEYLNSHSTVLYLLSSLVKPLGHLHHRLLQRSRFLQSQLQFPVRLADQFNQTIDDLTIRLDELQHNSLSKPELESFRRTHIDTPLTTLSDRLAKYQTNDELHQLRAATRLSRLEETLAQLTGQLDKAEQTLNHIVQQDQSSQNSPIHSLGKIVHELLESSPLPNSINLKSSPNPRLISPGPFKRPHSIRVDNNPSYFGSLFRLLNPFRTQSNNNPHHHHRQTKFLPDPPHDHRRQEESSSSQKSMPIRLFMWPIETIILLPISITTRILRLPLRLFHWIFFHKPSKAARRARRRDPHSRSRREHRPRLSPSPLNLPLEPSSPPSSASPVTSPDDSHSHLEFLQLHHPPLSQSAKNSHIQWAPKPAFYDHVNDDDPTYQHDHLF